MWNNSKVKFIIAKSFADLEDSINEFCKQKVVVGIQYPEFPKEVDYIAVVSYKVNEQ